jgi:hypothetical protein
MSMMIVTLIVAYIIDALMIIAISDGGVDDFDTCIALGDFNEPYCD